MRPVFDTAARLACRNCTFLYFARVFGVQCNFIRFASALETAQHQFVPIGRDIGQRRLQSIAHPLDRRRGQLLIRRFRLGADRRQVARADARRRASDRMDPVAPALDFGIQNDGPQAA